ncbi:MAG: GNAT family N-acetyltransferase [Hyphomicrobiales bacterium]
MTKPKPRTPRELPQGYVFRRPALEDREEIVAMMVAHDIAETGEADSSIEDLTADWTVPRFDLNRDAWLVIGPDRRIAAYVWSWDKNPSVEIQADYYVHPERTGAGLDEPILAVLETRGQEHRTAAPRGTQVILRLFNNARDEGRGAFLTGHGYARVRTFFRMAIDLAAGFAAPRWPAGITPRRYRKGTDDRALQETLQDAFSDHYAHVRVSHEEWADRRLAHPEFVPEICTLAWDGDQVAGALLPFRFEERGWIRELGVRAPWRGKGIGRALLLDAFASYAERGLPRVALGVDAENPTGATQLYESAGMKVTERFDLYEKPLGEGTAT